MKSTFPSASRRGSALVTVMMLSFALILIVTTILGYSLNERRLNHREAMRLEARNAAEALSEYGLAQVRQLMETRSNFTPTRFTSDEGQIVKPGPGFWGGSNVTLARGSEPELIIGLIAPKINQSGTDLYYFDPADPNNEFEPLKGLYAFRFDVQVISKATVNPPTGGAGGPQTTYMTQTLSARASPLFSHAIFYNMDLEFMPGGTMNIVGPVHTNGKLYVRSQSSLSTTSLNFTSQVTSAKGLYAAAQKQVFMQRNGTFDTTNYTSQVTFKSSSGTVVGLRNNATGMWNDQAWGTGVRPGTEDASSKNSFRVWTSQQYQGNLQTEVHGIATYNPVAIGNYQQGVLNEAHKLIEPAQTSSDTGYNPEIEKQKYARTCGIHIVVNPSSTTRVGRMPDGSPFNLPAGKYRVFARNGDELIIPGQPSYGINNATINPATRQNSPIAPTPARPIVTIKPAQMTDMRRSSHDFTATRSTTNPYSPRVLDIIEIDLTELKKAVDYNVNGLPSVATPNPMTDRYYTTGAPPALGTSTTSLDWTSDIYNPAATPSLVYNLGAANAIYSYVGGNVSPYVAGTWNGGVYIQSVDAESRKNSGVRLINGRGRLASSIDGTTGLTVATNDALYVLGHYNADGTIDSSTGPTSSARLPETGETPCSVICDAFTILSQPVFSVTGSGASTLYSQTAGWNDKLSDHACDTNSTWSTNWRTTPPSNSNAMDGNTNAATFPRDPIDPAGAPVSGDALN
ncbi:MAG: hypothetical protein NTV51_16410, partial [Verrucomicrobia bacterium]|nr:hypothetical protein [Verrucomicrobiota bacterium]